MQVGITQKYFTQKSWTVFEIICIIAALYSAYVSVYVFGGGSIGFAFFSISIGCFAISKTTKITAEDVEDELARLIRDNKLQIDKENSICIYDLAINPIKKGRDGTFRSRSYVISNFEFSENIKITVYRIDLFDHVVNEDIYIIPEGESLCLSSEKLETPNGSKEIFCLRSADGAFSIPVRINAMDAWNIIERVCGGNL